MYTMNRCSHESRSPLALASPAAACTDASLPFLGLRRQLVAATAISLLATTTALLCTPVLAQGLPADTSRNFPPEARRGTLEIGDDLPEVLLNGKKIRLSPGFRLFSADRRLIFAHNMKNQRLTVNYVQESGTQWLHTAWILTPQESKLKRPS
jgi:hypothetical protein